ncbi:hypothetical protein GSI_13870 [Ganoderma sinense ZZ0214-1]|uniref:DUF6533 domain-containing protein n=1 Tax=Ganoderma sinense ZZ0214-1 TaxID=1077348 RepID=A0A2G8RS09_9APHY|nr:hypothetical protein GSI_13870 [Ganoderma sinense ZZ0214-1]
MARFTGAVQATAEYWAWSIRMNNNFSVVGYAILFYDYTLTFSTEVECFWKSTHISFFSVLFVLNRYFGLLGAIPTIFEYFGSPSENPVKELLRVVLRTYALYERSRRILVLLIVTHVGGALVALVTMITTKSANETKIPMPFTLPECDLSLTNAHMETGDFVSYFPVSTAAYSGNSTQRFQDIAIAWAAMVWFDTTIFVLTLVRAWQMHRHMRGGILETLFRDGTIYYGIMVVSTVGNIITFLVTPSGSNLKGMETTLTNVLSTTLTSRLILNLRNRTARHIGGGRNTRTEAWTSTAAQSVISRVVFGKDQIKPSDSFELAASTATGSATETKTPWTLDKRPNTVNV